MMRREPGRVFFDLSLSDADLLCTLPRELVGIAELQGDRIRFECSGASFPVLLRALGSVAAGELALGHRKKSQAWVRVANAINEGNPDWRPYAS